MTTHQKTYAATPYHKDFALSITKALADQLDEALAELVPAPLTKANLANLDNRAGVYQLYVNDKFVYVGKADRSLPTRLGNHLRKLSGRLNISLHEITFSCLYVAEDFTALAPEQLLIKKYKMRDLDNATWNTNGFGNRDPGKKRDGTAVNAKHFDALFPIDLNWQTPYPTPGPTTLHHFLKKIKKSLPYNFRHAKMSEIPDSQLEIPASTISADESFRLISTALPSDWKITALLGYVIMYKDQNSYPSASRVYSGGQTTCFTPETRTGGRIVLDDDMDD